eukprot:7537266-Ditylum_brightwellii.AAC.1
MVTVFRSLSSVEGVQSDLSSPLALCLPHNLGQGGAIVCWTNVSSSLSRLHQGVGHGSSF